MKMKVYPYMKTNGYRSILEAVSRDDARDHLKSAFGTGVRFCEVDMDVDAISQDSDYLIGAMLAANRNFVT